MFILLLALQMVDFLVIRHNLKILEWFKMGYEYSFPQRL